MASVTISDVTFMMQGAVRTVNITFWTVLLGTPAGIVLGWVRATAPWLIRAGLGAYTDLHRSVPLVVQIVLFNSFIGAVGYPMSPFLSGVVVLSVYFAAYCAEIVRGGILAVPTGIRRASRSLGMTYMQDLRYIVTPLGLRAMLPSWIGLVLGVLKDSALVAAIGYIELLRASQIVITRTLEPLKVLLLAGAIYFLICLPISKFSASLEGKLRS